MLSAAAPERCTECGAAIPGGRAGCQTRYDGLSARARTDLAYAPTLRLAFDTYCMQHPETYCRSAKSYAAHLTGLCCGMDFAGEQRVYSAIQRWLNGPKALTKPPLLAARGALTVVDVARVPTAAAYAQMVWQWATSAWASYHTQHALAHAWIAEALSVN